MFARFKNTLRSQIQQLSGGDAKLNGGSICGEPVLFHAVTCKWMTGIVTSLPSPVLTTALGIIVVVGVPKSQVIFYQDEGGAAPVLEWLKVLLKQDRKGYANCVARAACEYRL